MKYIYKLTILIFISSCFISCSEVIVDGTTGDGNYYNWTVIPVSMDSVSRIAAANDDVAFIAGNSSYKVTGSNIERINFQDSTFHCGGVEAFDKNNAVFWGSTGSGTSPLVFKIYDTGVFTTYNVTAEYPTQRFIFISKNKFYFSSFYGYYLFDNGTVTELTLPPAENIRGMGKVGDVIYLFTSTSSTFSEDRVHRIINNSPLLVSSVPSQGRLQFLNSDVIRVTQDSVQHRLDYFDGANWTNFFSYNTPANTNFISYLAGNTRAQFLSIWFDQNSVAYCDVYSANTKYGQTNFPSSAVTPPNLLMVRTVSNYADNSYYIIDRYRATKILKGKLK